MPESSDESPQHVSSPESDIIVYLIEPLVASVWEVGVGANPHHWPKET
jgi:hypothetical protein